MGPAQTSLHNAFTRASSARILKLWISRLFSPVNNFCNYVWACADPEMYVRGGPTLMFFFFCFFFFCLLLF